MAPLPTTNTMRLVVDYRFRDIPSKVLFRFDGTTPVPDAIAAVELFHTEARSAFFSTWSVPGTCRAYDEGENFSTEFTITPVASGTGGSDLTSNPDAFRVELLGRTSNGRRVSWYFAGAGVGMNAKQRATVAGVSAVAILVEAMQGLITDGGLVGIDAAAPVLKQYANLVVNDYLTKQARRG